MNFRHKYLVITVRTLLGLLLVFSGVTGFLAGKEMQGVPEPMIPSSQSLWSMGLFQMIKTTEIVAGLMLICGFLPALAAIFVAPLGIGILVFNAMIAPAYLAGGIVVCLLDAYLGYAYWDQYEPLFART
jgi:uncharacterized membrane protein YphA (DoxX/SURF4 family)